ncbi:Nitric oxide oxidoreductase [Exophiala xenobiotica]|uniref:nitric oxide dioxygenase n=1 Tax=Vermiconidia calcicola TaxID=1690605 RepID=A0AAV9PSG1_9PEZI|nr:Nitric oxide oxidoreductase [Exophiala xenobiotica]KAK5425393.1 Nitric oxide oxidoreductase [Exophiala xenobiotica]KAK5527437.1 Nitric oxide oxidoreductase [Vermiconidia calcicola]KAK5527756.1 Nitric oxide oxidoreductase [Chaetothyriales sp. CCFEE 6169]
MSSALFHSSPQRHELSPEHTAIVKSTAPVLAEHGIAITSHFYKRLLRNHPELRNVFNTAHQSTGGQSAALAHAVWSYAVNIDNLGALTRAVSRIGNKHASLSVSPDQYPVVGDNLLASIKEVLGDAVDQPVLDAWKAAYEQLADIFINFERGLYQKAELTPGGWTGWREFVIARKVHESDEIISFHRQTKDKRPLPAFKAGQYISVRVSVPELGVYQPRQYSLSNNAGESAKGELPAGRISNVLHAQFPEGAELEASMPFGDFTLDVDADTPVVLISGGVGITPMMSMLSTITWQRNKRPVMFIHATRNGRVHAMKDYLSQVMQDNPQVSRAIFYEEVDDSDTKGFNYDHEGRVVLDKIKDQAILPNADYYLCGPVPFMRAQQESLEALGVPSHRIHSEVFGSGAA